MQRASMSRRSIDIGSPLPRARSSERFSRSDTGVLSTGDPSHHDDDDDGRAPSAAAQPHSIHRAHSDPFDAPHDALSTSGTTDDEEGIGHNEEEEEEEEEDAILPTLPRFPVADTRDKNCWSTPPVEMFRVRGVDYLDTSKAKKVVSKDYLLIPRGSDIFLTDKKHTALEKKTHSILGGQLRKKPTLAINFHFPWGFMNLYFEIPQKLVMYMVPNNENSKDHTEDSPPLPSPSDDATLSVAERTLALWLVGDTDYKNERLKLIPYVAEGPWVVRNMVTGRPALIGKKLPVSYAVLAGSSGGGAGASSSQSSNTAKKEAPLLTATLDIGSGSATAKRIVSVCRRYMSALTVDIGFVIQAECQDELPEQMMGALRVHGPDPLKAPKLV